MDIEHLIEENKRRLAEQEEEYDPLTGKGSYSCERKAIYITDTAKGFLYLPIQMFNEPLVQLIEKHQSFYHTAEVYSKEQGQEISPYEIAFSFMQIRFEYDFEFWCATTIKIKPKTGSVNVSSDGNLVPFILNRGQRKYLKYILDDWFAQKPIRIILVKARQWGGSTMTQIFMMWIQIIHKLQWNSAICAHVETQARLIRGMYTTALAEYPHYFDLNCSGAMQMLPYEGSTKTRYIPNRGCRITIGSAERPEGLRGEDISLAHFSEVSSFPSTDGKKPEDLIQSIVGGIPPLPYTFIVYESTAKGVGNFFHRQAILAKEHKSAFSLVFIAWFDIENYAKPIDDYNGFIQTMTKEELHLFQQGATLENISWYRDKSKEITDKWRLVSEFPSNVIEAFQSTGSRFYNIEDVDRMRKTCFPPSLVGDVISDADHGNEALQHIRVNANINGNFKVWALPDGIKMNNNRYIVVVDVNRGISKGADNGIICVFDRYWMAADPLNGKPEVVAEWAGHIIMRYFIWIAVKIAKMYNNAFLVIESNTPETAGQTGFEYEAVFDEIANSYSNMYYREAPADKITGEKPKKWGFHMNQSSKYSICTHQQLALANDMYIERSIDAVDEHDTFEIKDNGSLGATEGCHDDRHITRALGVWMCYHLPPPTFIDKTTKSIHSTRHIVNEATL